MAGLLDDEKSMKIMTNPLLQMGLGILANSTGPRGQSTGSMLGQGAMQGMQNVAQAEQMRANQQMRGLQALQIQQSLTSAQRQREAINALPEDQRQAVMAGVPYADIWKRQNPERKIETFYDDQGRETKGYMNPDGSFTPVGGSKKSYQQINLGDKIVFADPTDMAGKVLMPGMSPSDRDASARGWAGVNLQRQQMFKPTFSEGAGGFVYPPMPGAPQGQVIKPEGMMTGSNATEGERKAATLLKRMEGSLAQLNTALSEKPNAAKPSLIAEAARNLPIFGNEATANLLTGDARQRVEAAQLDILDAALTLGTGAAYTREQLEGHRKSYFPQIGDTPNQVRDKQERLANLIEAGRVAAGRAIPQGGSMPTMDLKSAAQAELERRSKK